LAVHEKVVFRFKFAQAAQAQRVALPQTESPPPFMLTPECLPLG
jgi:hypothetical protein